MRRATSAALLVLAATVAFAQDGGAPALDLEVRTERTLTDPGAPVPEARAAFASPGDGPGELAPTAVAADARGVVRLPFQRGGGTVLVWADGFAPVAVHAEAARPRTITLERAAPFTVQVFAPGGGPAAQATVVAEAEIPVVTPADEGPSRHPVTFRVAADSQGRALLTGLPGTPLSVTATAPGLVPARHFPVDPRTGSLVTMLGRGARIGGTLRLLPGMVPAAGAVALVGDRTATLDASGRFVVDGVVPGPREIRFEGRGFVPPPERVVLVSEGRDREDLSFEAWRTATLPGRLLDEDERPIAEAQVEVAWPPSSGRANAFLDVRADAEGRFRLGDLAPGDGIGLRFTSAGRVPTPIEGVSLPPGGESRSIDVVLPRGGGVAGTLTDLAGEPLAGAAVEALRRTEEDAGPAIEETATGGDGAFRFDGLPEGEVVLRVLAGGATQPVRFGPWVVERGAVREVGELRTFGGFPLAGRLEDAPAGVRVVVLRDGREIAAADVAEDGTFEFRGLPAGDVEVLAQVGDEVGDAGGGEVGASGRASLPSAWPVTLRWQSPTDLRALLLDEGGGAVAVATVRLVPLDAADATRSIEHRDAEGRLALRVAPGRWRIEAADARGATGAAEVVAGPGGPSEPVTVVLRPGVAVRGRAVDARDGRPLEGATVTAVPIDRSSAAEGPSDAVDDLGNFLLRGVPPGLWIVEVRGPSHPVHRTGPFVAREADGPDLGRIEVDPGIRIEGEVRSAAGGPGAFLGIEIATDAGTVRAATTDRLGRYALDGIEPGSAECAVVAADGRVLRRMRFFVPDVRDAWRLDVDLSEGGSVTGRVSAGGRDEPYARVAFRTAGPRVVRLEAVCDAYGAYLVEGLPPGECEVEVRAADASVPWTTRVALDGGERQWVDLRAPEGFVEGRVRASDGGFAVAGARVELRPSGETFAVADAWSGEDGRYALRRVAPGVYDVVATREGFGAATLAGVRVTPAGGEDDMDLHLRPEASVVLRLVDDRYRPVTDGWAEARLATPEATGNGAPAPPATRSRARARSDGTVVVPGLSRGTWRISAGGGALGSADLGEVRIDEGPNELGETILRPAGGLDVVAFRGPLGPASGVVVEVRDVLGRDPRPDREGDDDLGRPDPRHATDAGGRLRVPGLAPGAYRVWIEGDEELAVRVVVRGEAVTRVYLPVR